jgi:heptaprenyl diphosphate synthase
MRFRADHRSAAYLAPVALLLSVAVILGYVESVVLPPLPVPGLRLGLANIAVVVALATFGLRAAAIVSLGRVFLVALALGTLGSPSFVLALGGAVAALVLMALLSRAGSTFSVVGWSVAGSAAHVSAQLAVAVLIVGSNSPLLLMPVALGLSVPLGLTVGHIARLLLSRIPDWSLSAAGR